MTKKRDSHKPKRSTNNTNKIQPHSPSPEILESITLRPASPINAPPKSLKAKTRPAPPKRRQNVKAKTTNSAKIIPVAQDIDHVCKENKIQDTSGANLVDLLASEDYWAKNTMGKEDRYPLMFSDATEVPKGSGSCHGFVDFSSPNDVEPYENTDLCVKYAPGSESKSTKKQENTKTHKIASHQFMSPQMKGKLIPLPCKRCKKRLKCYAHRPQAVALHKSIEKPLDQVAPLDLSDSNSEIVSHYGNRVDELSVPQAPALQDILIRADSHLSTQESFTSTTEKFPTPTSIPMSPGNNANLKQSFYHLKEVKTDGSITAFPLKHKFLDDFEIRLILKARKLF